MNREEQYKRKLEFIIDKISILPDNIEDDIFYIDALFYRLIIIIIKKFVQEVERLIVEKYG